MTKDEAFAHAKAQMESMALQLRGVANALTETSKLASPDNHAAAARLHREGLDALSVVFASYSKVVTDAATMRAAAAL